MSGTARKSGRPGVRGSVQEMTIIDLDPSLTSIMLIVVCETVLLTVPVLHQPLL